MLITTDLLNSVTLKAKSSPRHRMNFNFHESFNDAVQRMINAIEPEAVIPIARHPYSNETLVLLRGRLRVVYYNDDKEIVKDIILDKDNGNLGIHIPKGTWHKVASLETGTVVFETREGPYSPVTPTDILEK